MFFAFFQPPPPRKCRDSYSRGLLIVLMMDTASTSETSVNFYQTTQRNNPEQSHLHTRRSENLKVAYKLP
jgi:hypothetical protein